MYLQDIATLFVTTYKKFIRFQYFLNQNVFWAILSNFDFLTPYTHTPPPPPPPPPITTKNEKTPDLA